MNQTLHNFRIRLADLIIGLLSMTYGWSAVHTLKIGEIKSQFQTLLLIEGWAFEIGLAFIVVGTLIILLSFSSHWLMRVISHGSNIFLWFLIMMLFLQYKEPGLPLVNGLILAAGSFIIILGILSDEKRCRTICLD